MFQFTGFAPLLVTCLQHAGLPHSEICGSHRMCQSPQLIAAYHVLHRLWEPRHPPYALSNFLVFCYYLLIHWVFTQWALLCSTLTICQRTLCQHLAPLLIQAAPRMTLRCVWQRSWLVNGRWPMVHGIWAECCQQLANHYFNLYQTICPISFFYAAC